MAMLTPSLRAYCFTKRLLKNKHIYPTARSFFKMSNSVAEPQKPDEVLSQAKKSNMPFAKNLFIGKFDQKMLIFPEVLNSNELQDLNEMILPIDRFFSEKLDSKSIDENAKIPDEVLTQIKELGLFGMQIPQEYGGLGLNATKYARINELFSTDGSIAVTLAAHQAIGLKGILIFGTDEQKQQYLPKLATGEYTAAFCLTEPSSGSDAASVQTRATLSEDGKTYNLNGGKIWITNGGIADVFTVIARTQVKGPQGENQENISAFIVERKFGGVTSGKPEDKLGIRGSNTCAVHFEDTPVPVENMLGVVGEGFKVAATVLNSGRFSMGSSSASSIRKLIGMVSEHAINRKQFGKPIKDFGLIQEKIGKMAVAAYAMESMSYVTAAIIDTYDNPDVSLEAAMVKIYSSEQTWACVNEALQIMGGAGYMKDYPFERYLRDARILHIFEGTNEILRIYIAISGIQFSLNLKEQIFRKENDPLNNLTHFWLKQTKKIINKTKYKLYDHVHPVLSDSAEHMESRLYEFSEAVHHSIYKYKDSIIDQQMLCKRIADICTDIYAMTCVLARASRSKSIGLKNCDHEVMLARLFCKEAIVRIDQQLEALKIDKHYNGDEYYRLIAKDIFKNGGYAAEHPLTRNWD